MGTYNRLLAFATCTHCKQESPGIIQFKYGALAQLNYHLGDTVTWGGLEIGDHSFERVMVYGILESTNCPLCNLDAIPEEYDIFVIDNIITSFTALKSLHPYLDHSTPSGGGEYILLK